MGQHGGGQRFDVLRRHVVPPGERRGGLGSFIESERSAGGNADAEARVGPRRGDDVHKVASYVRRDLDGAYRRLRRGGVLWRHEGGEGRRDLVRVLTGEDGQLLIPLHVAEGQTHEKAVCLRLGQGEGAMAFERVLRCHDHEGLGHVVAFAVNRHLMLRHRLQQRRLRPRRGAVDLVGQHEVGEHRAGPEAELTELLIVEVDAGQVAGQQIRRELDALEGPAHRGGEGAQQHRLACARNVLKQDVAGAEEADENFFDDLPFPDDHLLALT